MWKNFLYVLFTFVSLINAQENYNIELLSELASYRDKVLDIEIMDGYAYLATNGTGIQILDISDFDEIELVGAYWAPGASSIYVEDDLLYATDGMGVKVLDVSDKTNPVLIGQDSPGSDYIKKIDNYIIVRAGRSIISYDVTDPSNPQQVGSLETGRIDGLIYVGESIYMRYRNIFYVIDISDPADLEITREFELEDANFMNFTLVDHLMYSHCRIQSDIGGHIDCLYIIDTNSLEVVGSFEFGRYYWASGTWPKVIHLNGCLYLLGERLNIMDVSNPNQPDIIESGIDDLELHRVESYFIRGEFLFSGRQDGGFVITDINDHESPRFVQEYLRDYCQPVENIMLYNNSIFHNWGQRYDLSDPRYPEKVEGSFSNGNLHYTGEDQDIIYIFDFGTDESFWNVVDISGDEPENLCSKNGNGGGRSFIHDEFLFDAFWIGDVGGFFSNWDISRPDTMVLKSNIEMDNYPVDIWVNDQWAFVTDGNHPEELFSTIIDISDPENPQEIGRLPILNIVQIEDHLFGFDNDGLQVYDFSNPEDPEWIRTEEIVGGQSIFLKDEFAFIGCGAEGIRVFDISDMDNLIEVGNYNTLGFAEKVYVSGDLIFVFDTINLGIYEFSPTNVNENKTAAQAAHPFSAYPNPFNSTTKIEYILPYASDVTLSLYNLTGQRIETLVNGRLEAGVHRVMLDAGDMASGLYFLKLEGVGQSFIQKIMLVK